jgi:membrane-bound lytic murein transglycosylase D
LSSSRIHPGQTLAVRGNGSSQSYRIRRGDTLAGIAKRFNVTVNDLKRWNRLRSTTIHPGKTLVIQSSGS